MKKPLPACRRERGLFSAVEAEILSTETDTDPQPPRIIRLHWWRAADYALTAVNSDDAAPRVAA